MTGIILLVIYTVVMLAVTFKDRARDSLAFNVSNRNIGTWSGALSIAATWIWAPALFVSAEKSYSWGWQGLAWFLVPNVLCLMIFSPFANRIRKIFPQGVTLSGFMQERLQSRAVGNTYRFQLGSLAESSRLAAGKFSSVSDFRRP